MGGQRLQGIVQVRRRGTERNNRYLESLYYPTNAHNIKKNLELLKHIKIMEAAPTYFGLQRNHHQGATASA